MSGLKEPALKGRGDAVQAETHSDVKWLLVASGKGGSGKTSTSLNMAVYAVHEGLRVVIVDLDRQATLTRWYQRRPDEAPSVTLWAGPMADASKAIREIDAFDTVDLVVVDRAMPGFG